MSCIRVHLLFIRGCTYWHAAPIGKPSGESPTRETESPTEHGRFCVNYLTLLDRVLTDAAERAGWAAMSAS
jgi:hypothetical protein